MQTKQLASLASQKKESLAGPGDAQGLGAVPLLCGLPQNLCSPALIHGGTPPPAATTLASLVRRGWAQPRQPLRWRPHATAPHRRMAASSADAAEAAAVDRSLFVSQVECLALRVPKRQCADYMKNFKRFLLNMPRYSLPLAPCPAPRRQRPWSPPWL